MKQVLLYVVVGLAFVGGVVTASLLGFKPLAYISYHISAPSSNFTVIPANITLGNISPGSSGTIVARAKIIIYTNGTYVIGFTHEDELDNAFSVFNVTISLGNRTIVLSLNHEEASLYLSAGTYDVTVTVNYMVKESPEPPYTVSNQPFLIIYPKGIHEDEGGGS